MALELTSAFNVQLADDLDAYFDSFGREVEAASDAVGREIQPQFEADMTFYPARLPNQRYVRTFRLRDESSVSYRATEQGLFFDAQSGAPYDRYVRGTFNQRSRREATRDIARVHQGRWVPLWDITQFWQEAAKELLIDRIKQQYGEFVNTTIRRRSRIRG